MIADEYKKEMAIGCDIDRITNNMNKIERIPIIKKRETPASRNTSSIKPEQYKKMSNTLDVRIQSRQKRPNECVCVKRTGRAYKQCAQNNNKITANIG